MYAVSAHNARNELEEALSVNLGSGVYGPVGVGGWPGNEVAIAQVQTPHLLLKESIQ